MSRMSPLEELLEKYPVAIKVRDRGISVPGGGMGNRSMHHYTVKLTFEGRNLETDYWMGLGQ